MVGWSDAWLRRHSPNVIQVLPRSARLARTTVLLLVLWTPAVSIGVLLAQYITYVRQTDYTTSPTRFLWALVLVQYLLMPFYVGRLVTFKFALRLRL